ncbi:MAG: hypothetical protein ACK56I_05140, partial [bacterium]
GRAREAGGQPFPADHVGQALRLRGLVGNCGVFVFKFFRKPRAPPLYKVLQCAKCKRLAAHYVSCFPRASLGALQRSANPLLAAFCMQSQRMPSSSEEKHRLCLCPPHDRGRERACESEARGSHGRGRPSLSV